nr:hypothetical protein SHINE37_10415 [Rhizobiaceae bacterium]
MTYRFPPGDATASCKDRSGLRVSPPWVSMGIMKKSTFVKENVDKLHSLLNRAAGARGGGYAAVRALAFGTNILIF